jgi:carboxymethylenebutenolidase
MVSIPTSTLPEKSLHIMANTTQLAAADGHHLDAYLNTVPSAKAGVVILQEIFGVNHYIRSVVDRFAAEGFTAIAPALFDRVRPGIELGYDEKGVEEGKKLAFGIPPDQVLKDIEAAIQFVQGQAGMRKVGVVGYCFGGSFAWLSATRLRPSAAVVYYGSMAAKFALETPHCPVMMHFGEKDHGIPVADIEKIRTAHPEIPVYLYDAGHGFSCTERPSYAPEAAALAFSRTTEFLRKNLES